MRVVPSHPSSPGHAVSLRLIATASLIGTLIEWYDFFLYGTAAALVFNRLFFPTLDALTGTLAAFATFGVGFVARPIGGIVFGHFGDRIGRKAMLVITLLLMGAATCLIGLLPTHETAGVWAPVGLVFLRLVQGFGVGGEWGGAVLMVVEHAPAARHGFYGSLAQLGAPAGMALATIVFSVFSRLPDDQFLAWGWRAPFLVGGLLVFVGLIIRAKIVETPAFQTLRRSGGEASSPLRELFRTSRGQVLTAIGARIAENGSFYMYTTFLVAYATQQLHASRASILNVIALAVTVEAFSIPAFGALSDRVGRRPVYLFGAVLTALFAYPFFWLINTGGGWLMLFAVIGLAIAHAAMYGPQAAFLAEMFPTRVRYTGMSFAAQMASILAGGFAPAIATALLARWGYQSVALYIVGMAVWTIVAVFRSRETAGRED